jgi:hypothetical protein
MRREEVWHPVVAIGLENAGPCDQATPPMFEPEAEAMAPAERAALQQRRLAGLIDRLLAAGGPTS